MGNPNRAITKSETELVMNLSTTTTKKAWDHEMASLLNPTILKKKNNYAVILYKIFKKN